MAWTFEIGSVPFEVDVEAAVLTLQFVGEDPQQHFVGFNGCKMQQAK